MQVFLRSIILLTFLSFLLSGCTTNLPCGVCTYGLDEFVLDSHRLRENHYEPFTQTCHPHCMSLEEIERRQDCILEEDSLKISLYYKKRPDISTAIDTFSAAGLYEVQDGLVHLPELAPVEVAGLTIEEARQKIETAYRTNYNTDELEVFATLELGHRHHVYIITRSSIICTPAKCDMHLLDILCFAKINFLEYNLQTSYVLRNHAILPVNIYSLLYHADLSQNIPMMPGDKVFIGLTCLEDSVITVLGEIRSPANVQTAGKPLSLRQVLGSVGGIPFTGDMRYIQVIRGGLRCPKIYVINWRETLPLSNQSLLLFPGDMVYVSAKPITEWNRFIDQLLPCFGNVIYAAQGVNTLQGCF